MTETLDPILCRRALEALRAGVPSRDVVRLLPPQHTRARTEFEVLLAETEAAWESGRPARGLLVSGGFGMGKSHLLDFLRHTALESGFVCSRITLSKETPLSDLTRILRAATAAAVAPDRTGPALAEIADTLQSARAPHYDQLWQWAHHTPGLDPRIPASLLLFEREAPADDSLREKLLAEWNGFSMKVGELRAALKTAGEPNTYAVGRPQKGQEWNRFEFVTRFFRAAGYAGWVILLDEVELVARYSLRQRARAYAHLATLLGQERDFRIPGFAAAAAVTDDYAGEVLHRRGDRQKIAAALMADPIRDAAEHGMDLIQAGALPLAAPTKKQVAETYERVRQIYAAAYAWAPPEIAGAVEYAGSTRMRQYVRAWVNLWDLRRLYAYEGQLISETVAVSYEEDPDVEIGEPATEGIFTE